jgi:O-antigen/teichoic acid export membrane protein
VRRLSFLLKDSLVYGLAGAVNRFVKVLLVPVVARAFPVEIFGAYDAAGVYVYTFAVLAVLGLNSSVIIIATRDLSHADQGKLSETAGIGLRMVTLAAIVATALLFLAPTLSSQVLLGTPVYGREIRWAVASAPFSAVLIYALSVLQWAFRRTAYVLIAIGSALLTILLSYLVAFHTDWGLVGLFAANLVGQAVGAVAAVYAARDLLRAGWDASIAKQMLAVGLPFAAIAVASNLIPSLDRLFLVQAHSLADAGVYGMGQKIAALAGLILTGFQAAWQPFAFSQRAATDKPRMFGRVFLLICGIVGFLTLGLVCAAPLIARYAATPAYVGAAIFVGPLALSTGLGAVFFVVAMGSLFEGKSLHNLVAYGVGIGTTVVLNLVFLARGAPPIAIAWANCLGQAAAVACMAILSQRVHPIPYPFLRGVLVMLLAAGAAVLAAQAVPGWSLGAVAVAQLGLGAVFVAWLVFGVLEPAERSRLLARGRAAG